MNCPTERLTQAGEINLVLSPNRMKLTVDTAIDSDEQIRFMESCEGREGTAMAASTRLLLPTIRILFLHFTPC